MNFSYSHSENEYKGLTVERVKREEVFEHLSDAEAREVIELLEKYSINLFPFTVRQKELIEQKQ